MSGGKGRSCTWFLGAVVIWLTASSISEAENLSDVYALARINDPTFQSAQFALQAARQLRPEAFSALLPSLVGTASGSRTYGRTTYTDTPEVNRAFDTDQWTIQLTQPIFRLETVLAYDEAKASVEQAIAQFALAEQDLILRVTRAYFDEVVAERHVETSQAQVRALNEQLQTARHSYDAGVASITDVDDTLSRAAVAQAQAVAADNDRESARAAVEAIIGTPPRGLATLNEGATLPRPIPADASQWVSHATSDNPAVKAASAAISIAEYELDRSHSQRLPTVDLVATYGGNYSSGNITEPTNFGSNVKDRQVSIQVSVPLLEGGAIQARVGEARARKSKALADFTAAQRQAALTARQSYAAIVSGVSQVQALRTAIAAGRNAVKGNKAGYGLGIRINSDVLNAEQQLYSSQQDLDKAQYDTLFAGLQLKAAAGELSSEDLKALSSLLGVMHPAEDPGTP